MTSSSSSPSFPYEKLTSTPSSGKSKRKLVKYSNDDPIYEYEAYLSNASTSSRDSELAKKQQSQQQQQQTLQQVVIPLKKKSIEQLEEEEFWNNFKPGSLVAFCFRRSCAKTRAHCLNRFASCASNYIHVEVCVMSEDMKQHRSLYLTEQTKKVEFVTHDISYVFQEDAKRIWDFVWVRLAPEQIVRMKNSIYRLAHLDTHRQFNKCSIYCFCFFSMPCFCYRESTSAICTQTTMEFIAEVWRGSGLRMASNLYSYTPDNVYQFIMANTVTLNVSAHLDNINPNQLLVK